MRLVVERKPVCICRESPGGILSRRTHGKCGEAGPLTATTEQPLRVVAGAVRRVEPGGRWRVESSEVSFSGHRAAGRIRAVSSETVTAQCTDTADRILDISINFTM